MVSAPCKDHEAIRPRSEGTKACVRFQHRCAVCRNVRGDHHVRRWLVPTPTYVVEMWIEPYV